MFFIRGFGRNSYPCWSEERFKGCALGRDGFYISDGQTAAMWHRARAVSFIRNRSSVMMSCSNLFRLVGCGLLLVCMPSGATDKTATLSGKAADRIVIMKSAHTMTLMRGSQVLKTYKVALGNPIGTKKQEGDRETPEGE